MSGRYAMLLEEERGLRVRYGSTVLGFSFAAAVAGACADGTAAPLSDSGVDGQAEAEAGVSPGNGPRDAGRSDSDLCSSDGFCIVDLAGRTVGDGVTALWGDGLGVVWAGDAAGKIYHWDGKRFSQVSQLPLGAVTRIVGSGPTELWALSGGALFHASGADPTTLAWEMWAGPGEYSDIHIPKGGVVFGLTKPKKGTLQKIVDLSTPPSDAGAEDVPVPGEVVNAQYTKVFGSNLRLLVGGSAKARDGSAWSPYRVSLLVERAREPDGGSATWTPLSAPGGGIDDGMLTETGAIALALNCGLSAAPVDVALLSADGGSSVPDNAWLPYCVDLTGVWAASDTEIWAIGAKNLLRRFDGTRWTIPAFLPPAAQSPLNFSAIWGDEASGIWLGSDKDLLRRDPQTRRPGTLP